MAKFVRCIEGHVYDPLDHDVCPVCGAAPGDDAGSVATDESPKPDAAKGDRTTKGKTGSHLGASKAPPWRWLAVAGMALLVAGVAVYTLTSGDEPERVAQRQQAVEKEEAPSETEESAVSSAEEAERPSEESATEPSVDARDGDVERAGEETDPPGEDTEDRASADESAPADEPPSDEMAKLRARAQEHLNNKDYDSAIADFTDIIRTGKGSSFDYSRRGVAYHFKKQHGPALADYNRAIEFEDHDAQSHFYRATLFRDTGDADKAIEDLTEAIEDHGFVDPYYYGERALLFMRKSFYDRAVGDYDKAIDLLDKDKTVNPGVRAIAYHQRGQAKVKSIHERREFCLTLVGGGDCNYPESLKGPLADFKETIALKPDFAPAHLEAGVIAMELEDREEALGAFTKAIKADPAYSMAYANRCLVYNLMNEKELALADCNDAIRHDSKNPMAWAYRGAVHGSKRGRKNRNLAIADFRKALEVDPNNYLARETLKNFGVKP